MLQMQLFSFSLSSKSNKNNKTNQHEISRRTFPALEHLKPSQNLYFISRQIHALLSQQTHCFQTILMNISFQSLQFILTPQD